MDDVDNEGPSLRDALESAWDAAEAGSTGNEPSSAAPEAVEAKADETPEAAPEPKEAAPDEKTEAAKDPATGRDEKGKFVAKKAVAPVKPGPKVEVKPGPVATKAPQSWKPTERDAFGKASPEMQAAVARREAEFARTMQEVAPARQLKTQFDAMVNPYLGMMAAEGAKPMEAIASVLQTAAGLRTHQKEAIIAGIIQTYGADLERINAHLQGQAPRGQPQGFDPNQFAAQVEQRIAQRFDMQRNQALGSHYEQKLATFESSHEFMDDLRGDMAKLLESGIARDFEDAYNRAASMNADVSAAMRQREEAKRANAANASTQQARAAGSSLKSRPAGPQQKGPQGDSWRDVLEHHYDELSGQRR